MKRNAHSFCIKKRNNAFTLAEMLVSMTILMLLTGALIPFYFQSTKTLINADTKLNINDDIRNITNQLVSEAREADAFVLYDNYKGAWIDGDFVNFRSSTYEGQGRLRDGESGKFLLLLFYGDDPYPNDNTPAPLDKMIGVYLDADESDDEGVLRIFYNDSINNSLTMEENIPSASLMGTHEEVLESMTGMMSGDTFYNFGGKSIMLSGKITSQIGGVDSTNVYNFAITPR